MAEKPETRIVVKIIQYVQGNGGDAWHVHGSAMQRPGEPDIDGAILHNGCMVHFKVEVKTDKGLVSPIQKYRLSKWAELGYLTAVVRSLDDFKEELDRWTTR